MDARRATTVERLAPRSSLRPDLYEPGAVGRSTAGSTAVLVTVPPARRRHLGRRLDRARLRRRAGDPVLEGEPRGRAMKALGLRWRPLGYGALIVAALTGVVLASRDWQHSTAFQIVLWTKVVLFALLLVVSYLHNFVLGPRLQAEIRDGLEQRTRPRLVVVGWVSYSLTMALPILGVVLARLVG